MKRTILTMALVCSVCSVFAQTPVPAPLPADAPVEQPEPVHWIKGVTTTLGFSQLSLTNWAAGGYGQLSLNTFADAFANYSKDNVIWNNEIQAGYGFIESFETGYKKSDDRLIVDSKFGYRAVDKLYISSIFNMRTQFAKGYSGDDVVSAMFAPANISLGVGIDFTPGKNFSLNFAPLTGKAVVVDIPELRTKYGNDEDQVCRFELGAQLKADAKLEVENFKVSTSVLLFSDYLNKPQNVKVNWDANVEAKISKFFSVTLRTNMIYDDTVLITKKDAEGNSYQGKGLQFREIFSIGLTYTIGQAKPKK